MKIPYDRDKWPGYILLLPAEGNDSGGESVNMFVEDDGLEDMLLGLTPAERARVLVTRERNVVISTDVME